jgi:hypothetical protein
MSQRPGRVFTVGGRPLLDSEAVLGIAAHHDLLPRRGGWDLAIGSGSIRLRRVEGRPGLPGQDGALYEALVEGPVPTDAMKTALRGVKLERAGTFDAWPTAEVTTCGASGPSCGCRSCDRVHEDHVDELDRGADDEDDAEEDAEEGER